MDLNLAGRVIVVTGANRGIGLAIAKVAADEGAHVVLLARGEAALAEAVAEIGRERASAIRCDMTDHAAIAKAVELVGERHGRLDAVVNNAGRLGGGPVAQVTAEALREGFETKVTGAVALVQAALPLLRKSDQARVVNVSGVSAQRIMPGAVVTALANSSLLTLTAYMARELIPDRVNVNCIVPGYTLTPPWQGRVDALAAAEGLDGETAKTEILKRQDMGHSRWASDLEIAEVVVFLLSKQAGFVNGAAFRVDGGQFVAIQG